MGGLFDFLGKLGEGRGRAQDTDPPRRGPCPDPRPHRSFARRRGALCPDFSADGDVPAGQFQLVHQALPPHLLAVELNYAGQSVEFTNVSGKNKLEIKQTDLGRSLLYNYPVTPLLPFRGGTIGLDCGLVSMIGEQPGQQVRRRRQRVRRQARRRAGDSGGRPCGLGCSRRAGLGPVPATPCPSSIITTSSADRRAARR